MSAIQIELQACDPARNRYRAWRVDAGRDLFGRWNARVTFGRIGCRGRTQRHDFEDVGDVERFIGQCLRRRATAEKRVLVRYRLIDASPEAVPLLRHAGMEETPCSRFAEKVVTRPRAI